MYENDFSKRKCRPRRHSIKRGDSILVRRLESANRRSDGVTGSVVCHLGERVTVADSSAHSSSLTTIEINFPRGGLEFQLAPLERTIQSADRGDGRILILDN